jgi:hypothetical protein
MPSSLSGLAGVIDDNFPIRERGVVLDVKREESRMLCRDVELELGEPVGDGLLLAVPLGGVCVVRCVRGEHSGIGEGQVDALVGGQSEQRDDVVRSGPMRDGGAPCYRRCERRPRRTWCQWQREPSCAIDAW